jgi:acyl carrier protein phosphodiesterase
MPMNWLAHIYLSTDSIEFQLGNLLADTLKGRSWDKASAEFKKGLQCHLAIDHFTDNHHIVKQSKKRLAHKGHLRAVVIDLLYDHFLSRYWNHYSHTDRKIFIHSFYQQADLEIHSKYYPIAARQFIDRLLHYQVLEEYSQLEGIKHALFRTDQRLSPLVLRKECASEYYPAIQKHYAELSEDFKVFFPELQDFVDSYIGGT